jgi:hypothetical protein
MEQRRLTLCDCEQTSRAQCEGVAGYRGASEGAVAQGDSSSQQGTSGGVGGSSGGLEAKACDPAPLPRSASGHNDLTPASLDSAADGWARELPYLCE